MARPHKEARREKRNHEPASTKAPRPPFDWTRLGWILLILIPPFVFRTDLTDNFRLPKLWISETLVGLTLALLALRLWNVGKTENGTLDLAAALRRLLREPALLAVGPLLLVALLGAPFSQHPERTWDSLISFGLGAAFLVGLAIAIRPDEPRFFLRLLCWPAAILALLGILQFHEVIHPFGFAQELTQRLLLTSLAGGAFDLSAYLLLPALFALSEIYRAENRPDRVLWLLLAGLFVYGIALSQTLTVVLGFGLGCVVLCYFCLRLQFWRIVGAVAVTGILLLLLAPPLRARFDHARQAILDQDYNQLLSGRLDGWRVAGSMLAQNPVLGVGHGAFRSEFGDHKMALAAAGTPFFLGHRGAYFTNAHSELLETGAELGWPGILALLWGVKVIGQRALQRWRRGLPVERLGLELGMLGAMAVVSLANFPFHLALIAYPWLFFLASVLARDEEEATS